MKLATCNQQNKTVSLGTQSVILHSILAVSHDSSLLSVQLPLKTPNLSSLCFSDK